jgi:hypothetical protein
MQKRIRIVGVPQKKDVNKDTTRHLQGVEAQWHQKRHENFLLGFKGKR